MLKAVKTKLSNYLSPIFEKKKSDSSSSDIPSSHTKGRKRPSSEIEDCFNLTPGKKKKADAWSPLKLFDGFKWGNIFDSTFKRSISLTDMAEAESTVKDSFPSHSRQSEELDSNSRKILTATRRREYRVPLSQISNATILDLTNIDDDDDNDEAKITNVSIDLTKPVKSIFLHSKEVNEVDSSNVTIDLTEKEPRTPLKTTTLGKLPTSNMIGTLNRKKSTSFLHETVRLDEKTRYKTLLAHYTNVHLPEYSESISPDRQRNKPIDNDDSVTTLSSGSWFSRKYDAKPIFVDLTEDSANPLPSAGTSRGKFFHELLSQRKSSPSLLSASFESSSFLFPKDSTSFVDSSNIPNTPNLGDGTGKKDDISTLLDTDWIQKWRDTLDPIKLERERRIAEEEKRKAAIKRKQQEEFEEMQKKIQETAKVSEFIELTKEMRSQIKRALGPGSSRDVLVEGFNAEVTRADIATLRNSTWLNDEVVNFYFNLLKERSEKDGGLPKVHVFNTFFYPKIMKVGHAGVKRWTRKIDIFSFDLILIPVHLGMHWCLAVVDLKGRQIVYYDSLRGNNPQCILGLKKYLDDESRDKKKSPFNFDGWTEVMPKNIPEQMNGCDCGVFACKYAEYRSRNAKFTFTQQNMPYFRERMVYEICNKKLL